MASVEQRLQMKREPLDKWSVREQLCLASAVARSGDQNWMSVSRSLKPFGDANRPSDWFHQKNCAAQYGALLANVETPKRKKRQSGGDYGIETPAECILRQLKTERIAELRKLLAEEKAEYLKLQENMTVLSSGKFTEDQLDRWCKEIDEEENRKDLETLRHSQWLKERETRKMEIERAWRPVKPNTPQITPQKRKNSDSFDILLESEQQQEEHNSNPNPPIQETPKPQLSLSPLLTSLLKSPSQVQNINQASILHSAITNQRTVVTNNAPNINANISTSTATNPMIASLLNSTTNVAVSPVLQHLVSTAIGQETDNVALDLQNADLATPDILDDETLRNLKIEDIANSIIVPDGPLPEMKNDVDVIISDLIADPEQHLQLDNNGDININLELDDLDDGDLDVDTEQKLEEQIVEQEQVIEAPVVPEPEKPAEKVEPPVDPFEFQEDPEYEPKMPMKQLDQNKVQTATFTSITPPQVEVQEEIATVVEENVDNQVEITETTPVQLEDEGLNKEKEDEETVASGSVEIVEVAVEEEEVGKVLDKTQIQDIVHTSVSESIDENQKEVEEEKSEEVETVPEVKIEEPDDNEETKDTATEELPVTEDIKVEVKEEERQISPVDSKIEQLNISLEIDKSSDSTTVEQNFSDELYDDIQMEVKIDKSGKAKRDYSRTKKKEEKDFDILLAIEKAHMEENEMMEDFSDREFSDRKEEPKKEDPKSENERSNSPWTEEEDVLSVQSKRRMSTPATPSDSIPNSPASSSAYYDDDKEYRNWKKSIMLVYSWLAAHKYSSLFLKPITDEQAPGYHNLIYRPMDFHTLRKNIENGVIRTTQEFKRDVMLMLNNAIMYNKTNGTVYNMTRELQQEAVESIQLLLQAQSSEDAPPRRETRMSEPGLKRKRVSDDSNTRTKKRKED
ncbi:bromodomain-containing protein 8 isoform X1 [Coccinella septempunctata]|uniref:bromodomain-containing protein 8 isoform X1 n=1 Tax=Coccinella septempunctata TaxID=41139 RepID=UPI001D078743|nr:bromodomain-containing protein 8 isoform X1 [Coccinella septempunctata]